MEVRELRRGVEGEERYSRGGKRGERREGKRKGKRRGGCVIAFWGDGRPCTARCLKYKCRVRITAVVRTPAVKL
jgi:hypothetical protein